MNDNDHVAMLSASSLIGTEVVNLHNESLGKLEEVMIDLATGRIGYAVLSFGGVLGIGNKLFAVPWASLTVDEKHKKIVMDADRERLKNAPGFDRNNWPQTPNGLWVRQVYDYYGAEYR
ncbi:MAG: PRC-barrel domain-containing protein [Chloroflexota bacterium]